MLERRRFLMAAGASLALPWLEAFAKPASAVPGRAFFMLVPNGANMWRWHPRQFGADYQISPTLAPLDPLRKEMTIFSGLQNYRGVGAHNETGIFLTGNANYGGNNNKVFPSTISIDQHMAAAIGGTTRIPSMVVSPMGGDSTISYRSDGAIYNAENNLRRIFGSMFATPDVLDRLERRGSALDLIRERAGDLSRDLGQADRQRLEGYLDSVREVERRIQGDKAFFASKPPMDVTTALSLDADPVSQRLDYMRTLMDLCFLALRGGHTRLITLCACTSAGGIYSQWPMIAKAMAKSGAYEWHHSGHSAGVSPDDDGHWEFLAGIDRWWTDRLAELAVKMAETDEGGHSMLASTIIHFGYGMSWGGPHYANNLPNLIIGGSRLGIKHAGHLRLNPHLSKGLPVEGATIGDERDKGEGTTTTVSDLLRTISERLGVPAEGFGGSTRVLDEILA